MALIVLGQNLFLDGVEQRVDDPVDAESRGQRKADPQRHERHHPHHHAAGAGRGVVALSGDVAGHGRLGLQKAQSTGNERDQHNADHGPAAGEEIFPHIPRHDRKVKAEEVVVHVEKAVKLAGKIRKVVGNELGKADLLIALAHELGIVAQGGGKGRDLRHDVLGEHHEAAERLTDDGIQSDEDGEGQEAPEASAHVVHALLCVEELHLLVHARGIIGVFRLDLFHLGLEEIHAHHALFRLHLEGQGDELHDERKEHQCPAVGAGQLIEGAQDPGEGNANVVADG